MPATLDPPRTDRRRSRTRTALLRAGQALFADHSVDAVSVDDIVLAAEVAKGSFYNHFADKEALAREIARQVRADVEAQITLANDGIDQPARRVARAMAVCVRFARRDPARARALTRLHAGAALPDAPMNAGVRADVEAGLAGGDFLGLGLEAGVLMVMGATSIAMVRALEGPVAPGDADITGEIAFALLRGLGLASGIARDIADGAVAAIAKETPP